MKRLLHSLSFRIPYLYQFWLRKIKKAKHKKQILPEGTYHLLFLCGSSHLDLLEQSLFSVFKNFVSIPKVYVFTDKGLVIADCKKRLKWFPIELLTILSHSDCEKFHQQKGNKALVEFARMNPMGLKLAAISQIAALGKPFLYSDTDVLWFKDPKNILKQIISEKKVNIHLSQDFQKAYDQHLIDEGNLNTLNQAPYYCAGILFGTHFNPSDLDFIQSLIDISIKKSNHFTEQTIFAALQKRLGESSLDAANFCIQIDDRFDFIPQKNPNLIARHYIGPVRHLFWRDSFLMNRVLF
jgi:hypothetical protein